MRITKIYNNNVLSAIDDEGREVVLAGRGVGFSRSVGEAVDPAGVEKVFVLASTDRMGQQQLLVSLPYEIIALTAAISRHLQEHHRITLPATVEIGLADHLHTSLERVRLGIDLHNSMLWETKSSYPDEFRIALEVLAMVEQGTGTRLPLDEAGFIAMHLVNAGLLTATSQAYHVAAVLRELQQIVYEDTGIRPDEQSAQYIRFLTHLKFVIQRLTEQTTFSGNFNEMFAAQKTADPEAWRCARRIADCLAARYSTTISDEETLYLMLHTARLKRPDSPSTPETR